ncbi:MAG: hypothetical protein QOG53_485 [Frankiales bacterium]|jgi:hypothetical protein|nr:hypothetical protein [Frankiales bacterium]
MDDEPTSFREKATATVAMTASAIAADPVGTLKALASLGAKTAIKLPLTIGAKAAGPALGVAMKALELGHRRGQIDDGHVPPAPDPMSSPIPPPEMTPTRPTIVKSPVPEVRTLTSAPTEVPPAEAVEVGAPGTASAIAAAAEDRISATTPPGAALSHDELPLPDYDHLTLPSLRARLARLDLASLVQILDYEKAHANRLPVVTMLENRIAKLSAS